MYVSNEGIEELLKRFVHQRVKVVYQDGDREKAVVGELSSFSSGFVIISFIFAPGQAMIATSTIRAITPFTRRDLHE